MKKRKIIIGNTNKPGEPGVFTSWAKALKAYDLYRGSINAEKARARLEEAGYLVTVSEIEEVETVEPEVIEEVVEQQTEIKKEQQQAEHPQKGDQIDIFANSLRDLINNSKGNIDPEEIKQLIDAEIGKVSEVLEDNLNRRFDEMNKPRPIEIRLPNQKPKSIGRQHKRFETLLQVSYGKTKSPLLVGPAGSFKTSAAEKVAEVRELTFYPMSVGAQTTTSAFLGYMDANGNYVTTIFRKAFENGGLFLLDEMDAGNANVLTILNNALSGKTCSFPDGVVKKHKDFVCIAAANTFGTGADRMYVGRNELDAASRNRFLPIIWDYDEDLEREICGNEDWFNIVIKHRRTVEKLKYRVIISPRETFAGAELLTLGMDIKTVEQLVIFEGLKEDQVKALKAA